MVGYGGGTAAIAPACPRVVPGACARGATGAVALVCVRPASRALHRVRRCPRDTAPQYGRAGSRARAVDMVRTRRMRLFEPAGAATAGASALGAAVLATAGRQPPRAFGTNASWCGGEGDAHPDQRRRLGAVRVLGRSLCARLRCSCPPLPRAGARAEPAHGHHVPAGRASNDGGRRTRTCVWGGCANTNPGPHGGMLARSRPVPPRWLWMPSVVGASRAKRARSRLSSQSGQAAAHRAAERQGHWR